MKKKKRGKPDKTFQNLLILTGVMAVGSLIYWRSLTPPQPSAGTAGSSVAQAAATESQRSIPPFFASAKAAKPYPKLVPAVYYRRYPLVERAYKDAAEIPGVVAQQPCYCYCDRVGHHSLLDCYASDHAARCLICIKEVVLAKQMTEQKKSPVEIRRAIIRGEWQNVDVGTAGR